MDVNKVKLVANEIRMHTIEMLFKAGSGHPGGSLSIADILAVLYVDKMKFDPKNPNLDDRDRFVLSKGHASAALYSTLALMGFFPVEKLDSFRKIDSFLQGHPDMKHTPGVDMTTGSLGQGISAACGMALAAKLSQRQNRVYAIIGDGELEEGEVWEALMFANQYKLSNLTVILDFNRLQIDGPTCDVMDIDNPAQRFQSFHLNTIEIDGHNLEAISQAIDAARSVKDKPTVIIAHTVKGKGVSFMENQVGWHGKAPNDDEYKIAMEDLEKAGEALCQM